MRSDLAADISLEQNTGAPERRGAADVRVLGLPFFAGTVPEVVTEVLKGGLVVAPAAPTLACEYVEDAVYREALRAADIVLPDSGAMVLFWNVCALFRGRPRLQRLSGLRLIDALVASDEVQKRRSFWVMPSEKEAAANVAWLQQQGFSLEARDSYIAPHYARGKELADPELLQRLEAQRPEMVVLNIGGGAQEPLGAWLKRNLSYRPAIICTGAAIAFRSGLQAPIPLWADSLYLGWLFRIASAPRRFWPRYWKAWRLARLIFQYGDRAPGC